MEPCLNKVIDLTYSKNYSSEEMAIRQVDFLLKGYEGQYRYVLAAVKNSTGLTRIVPIIIWNRNCQHNIMVSVNFHLFTTN